jgi:TonB-linked SusC/RagA family outer membrane protein
MNFNILCKGLRSHKKRGGHSDYLKSKLILIMKLTTILMIACCLHVSATGYSQKITLSEKNAPLTKVLQQIRKQSGFQLLYDSELLKKSALITVDLINTPIAVVLDKIFSNQPFTYSIDDKTILVKERITEPRSRNMAVLIINGTVKGTDGLPLPSVTVKIKGANKTTATNAEGKFSVNAPEEGTVLVFSCVGMITVERLATQGMVVIMQPDLNKLNDLVVIGYGSARRKDLTGSVATININEVRDVPFATIDQALTGKAAGVQVVQADGSPGGVAKIRVRGGTSLIGGNDPLYIIDGVQVQVQNRFQQTASDIVSPVDRGGQDDYNSSVSGNFARGLNSLGGLNINDIESITILKDASATAIYGSRGANGVVIITTKKGKTNQKPTFEANVYNGFSFAQNEKVLNRDQYIMIVKEAAKNLNEVRALVPGETPDGVATQILTDPDFFGTANTNFMDLVTRTGITKNADLSVRGGGSGSRYYTSLSYNKNEGTVIGTDFRRIAGKVSLDNEISSRFRVNSNLDYGFMTNNITNGLYTQALFAPPTFDPYNSDGSIKILDPADVGAYAYQGFQNPLLFTKGINRSNTIFAIGSLAAEYDILKSLTFRSSVAVNYNNYRQTNYVPSTVSVATPNGSGSSGNGTATQAQAEQANTFIQNMLTWKKEFNDKHSLDVVLGTDWQITKQNAFSASGQGFPDDTYLNNLSSAAITLPSTGTSGQNSLLSFYLRANYSFMNKYLVTFTGRSDASSKFPKANRVGYFPSGGLGWRISQENFLKDVKWINELKLRASAGYTGTQNIADNLFYTLYSPVSYAGLNGLSPTQLGNQRLKWESTLQKDAGLEFELFNSRLRGEIGYYEKITSGILFPTSVAGTSGFNQVTANIAKIRNRGLELMIGADFIRNKNFQWSGTFNIAGNRSKVLALNNDVEDPANPGVYRFGNTVLKVGEPVGLLYGRVFKKILTTQDEVNAYQQLSPSYYPYLGIGDASYEVVENYRGYQGYTYFKDDIIGRAEPKFYGGYTNRLSYKNFSVTTLATFSYGNDIFYLADIQNRDVSQRTNKGIRILDRWTPENPTATRPRLILGESSYAYAASDNVYDASFIKLKSVTLAYQLPKSLTDKLKINSVSAYVSGTNLLTITSYPGVDPEVSNDPYSLVGGYSDSGGYPFVRQISIGLRIGL